MGMLIDWSTGLPSTHPLHSAVDRINKFGPFIGVVMAYPPEAEALQSSGDFVARSDTPYVDLYGRRFHIGSIHGVQVIHVLSGERRLNAGITVQTLLNVFDIWGIVHYGTAGSANNSMSFGDVSVPNLVAFTGAWTWTRDGSKKQDRRPELRFGKYNVPTEGQNLLSGVQFKPEELYSAGKSMEEVFWIPVDQEWYAVAERLQVELQRCVNETYCLPEAPKIVSGLRASTADVFVDNAEFREFLFTEFGVSTTDEESAAVVMTAISPGVPVIVFRAVSDLAGGEERSSTSMKELASSNSLKAAVEFIKAIGKRKKNIGTFK